MRYCLTVAALVSGVACANPAIDMDGYLRISREAAGHRETRRVSEAEFMRMSREPGTVILDARSREKFDELHVAGAINLPFPDIAIEQLLECRGAFPGQDRARLAQSLDLHRALQLRLPQYLRAGAVDRYRQVKTSVQSTLAPTSRTTLPHFASSLFT